MSTWLAAILLVIVIGCSKKQEDAPSATGPAKTNEPVPAVAAKQPLTAAWFGKAVAPPGVLGKLKLNTPVDEAKKLVPIADSPSLEASEIEGVSYGFTKDIDRKLTDTLIKLPSDKLAMIEEAWGKGQDADRGGSPVKAWFNPETGVRAAWNDEGDGKAYLRFEPYMPLEKLLGEGVAVAALSKPFVGLTKEEVAKAYPDYADKDGKYFRLPATEWEFGSGIPLSAYPMEGAIESFAFSVPFNEKGKGVDEVMAAITKKWGKAKEVETTGGDKTEIYNKKNPRIEVTGPGGYNPKSVSIRVGK